MRDLGTSGAVILLLAIVACGDDSSTADVGSLDSGTSDVGPMDSGSMDSGAMDAEQVDSATTPDAGPTTEPLWVATGWTQSGDEYNGFLAPVSDLLSGELALGDVVDLGTDMSFGTDENGTVFVGRSDSPVIQRWALDADGVLQMTGEVNLSGLGITSTMGGNRNVLQFISETRAYYFDNEGFRVVVFDPSEMTITEDFSIGEIRGDDVAATSMNFIAREGDRFFVSARTWDADDEPVRELNVAIVSATSSAVEYATDDRCADIAFVAKDSAGGVYFSTHHALPIFADAEDATYPQPCMLRIAPGESDFDASYQVDLNELVGGIGAGLFQGPNGTGFVMKYESADPLGSAALRLPVWRIYSLELGNEEATVAEVPTLPLVARFAATFETEIDGTVVPFLVSETETSSTYTSLSDPSAPADGLSVSGAFLGRAARLR